jgi:hypothetical protein
MWGRFSKSTLRSLEARPKVVEACASIERVRARIPFFTVFSGALLHAVKLSFASRRELATIAVGNAAGRSSSGKLEGDRDEKDVFRRLPLWRGSL